MSIKEQLEAQMKELQAQYEELEQSIQILRLKQSEGNYMGDMNESRQAHPVEALNVAMKLADELCAKIGMLGNLLDPVLLPPEPEAGNILGEEDNEARSQVMGMSHELCRRITAGIKQVEKLTARLDM